MNIIEPYDSIKYIPLQKTKIKTNDNNHHHRFSNPFHPKPKPEV